VDDQIWSQDSPGIRGGLEAYDHFGHALASADFDHDGYADLAVGAPGESIGAAFGRYEGAVHILYGSPVGLTATGDQLFTGRSFGGVLGHVDQFGLALATGDFDADGFADLAIGSPGRSETTDGLVVVLSGSATGLRPSGAQSLNQSAPGVDGATDILRNFGGSLAVGDLDADGYDDIAIGVALEPLIGYPLQPGAVIVAYGGVDGLRASGSQRWSQDSPGIDGDPSGEDMFGSSLAIGDLDRDGFDDLAVGVPHEPFAGQPYGAVHVIYGTADGLTASGTQYWNHETPDIPYATPGIAGTAGVWVLGAALEAADFDADGDDDLAIGAPYAITGPRTGGVLVLPGSTDGLTGPGGVLWSENAPGVPGSGQTDDAFGRALGSADFDGDGYPDLAIGVWSKDLHGVSGAGSVVVLAGAPGSLRGSGALSWSQRTPGVKGTAERNDLFGYSLSP
jgi:hypothetical protein